MPLRVVAMVCLLLLAGASVAAGAACGVGASEASCAGGLDASVLLQSGLRTSQLANHFEEGAASAPPQAAAASVAAAPAPAAAALSAAPSSGAEVSDRSFSLAGFAVKMAGRMVDGLNRDYDPFNGKYYPSPESYRESMQGLPPAPATGAIEKDVPTGAPAVAEPVPTAPAEKGLPAEKKDKEREDDEDNDEGHKRVHHTWHKDAFDADNEKNSTSAGSIDGDEGLNFFRAASTVQWVALIVFCLFSFVFDLLVLQRFAATFKAHMMCIGVWLAAAGIFNAWIFATMGETAGVEWTSGYFLEWMLSMDNLFVFHLIFKKYKTPASQIHYAVFVGIFGALLLRMVFFMVLSTLLHMFHWIRLPFGALLIWSGIETAMGEDDDEEVQDLLLIRGLKAVLGNSLAEEYDEPRGGLFRWKDGKLQATLLLIVVFCLEATDVLFALDSVSAKVAQIPNQYLAFSSSVIAMFGLRAMFFIIEDLVDMFHLLAYGLCLILVFIGVQLIFARWLHLPASTVCILIMSVFAVCIAGSCVAKKREDNEQEEAVEAK